MKQKIIINTADLNSDEEITITISKGRKLSTNKTDEKLNKILKIMATNAERLSAALDRIEATYSGIQSDYTELLELIRKEDVSSQLADKAEAIASKFEAADAQFPSASTEPVEEEGDGEFGEEPPVEPATPVE